MVKIWTCRHLLRGRLSRTRNLHQVRRRVSYHPWLSGTDDGRAGRTAIADADRPSGHAYADLAADAAAAAAGIRRRLLAASSDADGGARVAFLCPNTAAWARANFGVWLAGAAGVPLCTAHPAATMRYYVEDSRAGLIVASRAFEEKARELSDSSSVKLAFLEDLLVEGRSEPGVSAAKFGEDDDALLIYTSGTTGPPKGAVVTHGNVRAQAECMVEAWGWTKDDRLLHVLPLHHVHGVTNCLLTPLSVGAAVDMLPAFDEAQVWRRLLRPSRENPFANLEDVADEGDRSVSLFMAVPTIYAKLLKSFDRIFPDAGERKRVKEILTRDLRLMVSGSAALPEPILTAWREVSGHTLLERYGMTEIGMALTNPLAPEADRRPGHVGRPFPGVQARIVGASGEVAAEADSRGFRVEKPGEVPTGELQVRGRNVFKGYHGKPEATAKEFAGGGWFRTGDTAAMDPADGAFRILGRSSVDIIKSGGYKISALDVERTLLSHPAVSDVAVVGVDDPMWGQTVAAVVVAGEGANLDLTTIRKWAEDRMPSYSLPRKLKLLDEMPRNQMGKVNKKELVKLAFPESD